VSDDLKEKDLVKREIDSIRQRYLWCATFERMNDPMEGLFRPSTRLRGSRELYKVQDRIYESTVKFGIACFTDTRRNELMWAHYAGNYSGICIGYRTQDFVAGLPSNAHLIRLGYDDQAPRLSSRTAALELLSQKKSSWAYEREWRVLVSVNNAVGIKIIIRRKCITHIYLGARIQKEHQTLLMDNLDGTGIAITKMAVEGYNHKFKNLRKGTIGARDRTDEYQP
jgi:hypothetical protein